MTKRIYQQGYGLIASLLSLFFSIIIGIIAIRFVFKLIGANASNGIVNWFYAASQPLVAPFSGIVGHDISFLWGVIEVGTIIALIVYGIVAAVVTGLFSRTYSRTHTI